MIWFSFHNPPSCRETARGTTKGVITHALIKIYQVMY